MYRLFTSCQLIVYWLVIYWLIVYCVERSKGLLEELSGDGAKPRTIYTAGGWECPILTYWLMVYWVSLLVDSLPADGLPVYSLLVNRLPTDGLPAISLLVDSLLVDNLLASGLPANKTTNQSLTSPYTPPYESTG
jgi:hypothetical protein